MSTPEEGDAAKAALNGTDLDGRAINVDNAREQERKPGYAAAGPAVATAAAVAAMAVAAMAAAAMARGPAVLATDHSPRRIETKGAGGPAPFVFVGEARRCHDAAGPRRDRSQPSVSGP